MLILFYKGQLGEIGPRGAPGKQVSLKKKIIIFKIIFHYVLTKAMNHYILQGEEGPDGIIGIPGVPGPQVLLTIHFIFLLYIMCLCPMEACFHHCDIGSCNY